MQFSTKTTEPAKPAASVASKKKPLTWEAAYEMAELCKLAQQRLNKICAKKSEEFEVINNLTLVDLMKSSNALESLAEKDLKDLSDAMGESIESLKSMSVEDFSTKIEAMMPDAKAEASTESAAVAIAIALYGVVFAIIVGSAVAATKMTKYEFWFLDRGADQVLKEKGKKALDEVMIQCFDAKEFDKQIAACNEILDFLNKDSKEIYGEKTKIVDIEKMALKLWAAPSSIVQTSSSSTVAGFDSLYTQVDEWFTGWRDNCPEAKMKTLKEHGFTYESLCKTCDTLIKMCTDYVTLNRTHANFTNGHYELKKKITPGFWKSIKLWFTEKKEDREARKQEELILNAKYAACQNLARGYDWCVREMCNQFFAIAVKTEKYVKADKSE